MLLLRKYSEYGNSQIMYYEIYSFHFFFYCVADYHIGILNFTEKVRLQLLFHIHIKKNLLQIVKN